MEDAFIYWVVYIFEIFLKNYDFWKYCKFIFDFNDLQNTHLL